MSRLLLGIALLFAGIAVSAPRATLAASAKPSCAAGDPVVWENTSSHVYHLPGDKYYGSTKHGRYACKSIADAAGFHAPGGAKPTASATPHERMMNDAGADDAKPSATPHERMMNDAGAADATPVPSESPMGIHRHHRRRTATPVPSPEPT